VKDFVNVAALLMLIVVGLLLFEWLKNRASQLTPNVSDGLGYSSTIPLNLSEGFFDYSGFTGFDPSVFLGGS
jgi:hypothetical protein